MWCKVSRLILVVLFLQVLGNILALPVISDLADKIAGIAGTPNQRPKYGV